MAIGKVCMFFLKIEIGVAFVSAIFGLITFLIPPQKFSFFELFFFVFLSFQLPIGSLVYYWVGLKNEAKRKSKND